MKRKLMLLLAVLLIVSQFSFAEPLKFYAAADGLDVYQVTELKSEVDFLSLQATIAQRDDLMTMRRLVNKYDSGLGLVEGFRTDLAIETMVDKNKLANRIKKIGYNVEQNATFFAARQLYLATLKAKLDAELAQLKYDNALSKKQADEIKWQNGTITENDYLKSSQLSQQAANDLASANINYDTVYGKLTQLMHNDVVVEAEQPRLSALAPLDYYYGQVDNRFEIRQAELQIEIIDLDLPLYTERYLAVPELKREYDALLIDKEGYQLDIEQARYKVKKEVQAAYIDIEQAIVEVEALSLKLSDIRARLAQMETLYQQGVISQQQLADFRINVKQLENGYYLKSCLLNNKRIALQMAVSAGPAYQEE